MSGASASNPSYISPHSADVILSDIRPLKLKIDALLAINSFLDEFLHRILHAANSYSTDKLRDGLLKVLPTSLGKDLLLEAEVELRAYWERTSPPPASVKNFDDSKFRLQWAYELLRLKCEAYSTLNDAVQDADAELRLNDRLAQNAEKPPAALVAPAALYLTAIIEAMCEHILSNVGRVASRDSSRMHATGQDLFVALCEDDALWGVFKKMQVYEQIEGMSKGPKPRRSKSLSRSEKATASQSDLRETASTPKNRLSSDSGSATNVAAPRTSSDKSRAKKLFNGSGRTSQDGGSHKRSQSNLSEDADVYEDPAVLQEFDNLMRSDSTMKVSLTPDRLKTMEMYKLEKGQRGNRRPPPMSPLRLKTDADSSSSSPSSRPGGRHPSLRHVDSIIEDEEEGSIPKMPKPPQPLRTKSSVPSSFNSAFNAAQPSPNNSIRTRAASVSNPMLSHNNPRNALNGQNRAIPMQGSGGGFPPKTRRVQRNRESLDLDDVMAGDDDDDDQLPPVQVPQTPRRIKGAHSVSASTRELLDFLDDGPPVTSPSTPGVSKAGRELMDFLAEGPPDHGVPDQVFSPDTTRKGSGRLQRMISKLSLSNSEKARNADDGMRQATPRGQSASAPYVRRVLSKRQTGASLPMPIAPKPIPPRPRPMSPPPSPPGPNDEQPSANRSRRPSASRKAVPIEDRPEAPMPIPVKKRTNGIENGSLLHTHVSTPTNDSTHSNASSEAVAKPNKPPITQPIETDSRATTKGTSPTKQPSVMDAPAVRGSSTVTGLSVSDAHDIRRLLSRATNADECRVIFDMFMAKSGLYNEPTQHSITASEDNAPYPSPSLTVETNTSHISTNVDRRLELSVVEMLLGGEHQEVLPEKPQVASIHVGAMAVSSPLGKPSEERTQPSEERTTGPEEPTKPVEERLTPVSDSQERVRPRPPRNPPEHLTQSTPDRHVNGPHVDGILKSLSPRPPRRKQPPSHHDTPVAAVDTSA